MSYEKNPITTGRDTVDDILDEIEEFATRPWYQLYRKLRKKYGYKITDEYLIYKAATNRDVTIREYKMLKENLKIGRKGE